MWGVSTCTGVGGGKGALEFTHLGVVVEAEAAVTCHLPAHLAFCSMAQLCSCFHCSSEPQES